MGRRSLDEELRIRARMVEMLQSGDSDGAIIRELGVARNTVRKARASQTTADKTVATYGDSEVVGIVKTLKQIDQVAVTPSHVHKVGDTVQVNGVERRVAKVLDDGRVEVVAGALGRIKVLPDCCKE